VGGGGVRRRAVAGMVGILIWHCTGYIPVEVTNQCFNGSCEHCPGFTLAPPNVAKVNIQQNFQISFCKMLKTNLFASCETTAQTVSFEWSHHRILCTDSKVRTTWRDSIVDSERKLQPIAQIFFIMYVFVNSGREN